MDKSQILFLGARFNIFIISKHPLSRSSQFRFCNFLSNVITWPHILHYEPIIGPTIVLVHCLTLPVFFHPP